MTALFGNFYNCLLKRNIPLAKLIDFLKLRMYAQFQVMIILRPSISELQAWDMVLLLASLEREVGEIFLA